MTKPLDNNTIGNLAGRVNGAASLLTAIDMGLIPLTDEAIRNMAWTLRDAANRLEGMTTEEGAKNETL